MMAHPSESDPKLMDLQAVLAEVQRLLEHQAPKNLRSTEKYEETDQAPGGSASAEAESRTWDKCPFTQPG